MEKKFKIGDIVQLKSGGPEMTVAEHVIVPFTGKFEGQIKCAWFINGQASSVTLDQDTLEKV